MEDKETKYWFKRRRYGYGWIPATWQGWLTLVVFLAVVISAGVVLAPPSNTFSAELLIFLAVAVVAVVGLMIISQAKGPDPKWRWGSKDTDDPDEDF